MRTFKEEWLTAQPRQASSLIVDVVHQALTKPSSSPHQALTKPSPSPHIKLSSSPRRASQDLVVVLLHQALAL